MNPLIRILMNMNSDKNIIRRPSGEINSVASMALGIPIMVCAQIVDARSADARHTQAMMKARNLDIPHTRAMRALVEDQAGLLPRTTNGETFAIQDHAGGEPQSVARARPQGTCHFVIFDDPIAATTRLRSAAIGAPRETGTEAEAAQRKRHEHQRPRRRHEDRPVGIRSRGRGRRPVARVISRN